MKKEIPEYLKEYLGEYTACFFDSWCGEPIAWGYQIIKRVNDDSKWRELSNYGELECGQGYPSAWYLITKSLNREEAIEKYGKITDEEFGPRGGFRSVTFGSKKFGSKRLRG